MKYLGNNLSEDVKDLYTENYKILLREIKWRDTPYLSVRKLNIVNISILPKLIFRLNPVPNITPAGFHENAKYVDSPKQFCKRIKWENLYYTSL